MDVRIASAIVCVVLAALLALTFLPGFGPPRVVEPTGGVTNGPADDLPSLEASAKELQTRTLEQRWRGASGPALDVALEGAATAPKGDAAPGPASEEE